MSELKKVPNAPSEGCWLEPFSPRHIWYFGEGNLLDFVGQNTPSPTTTRGLAYRDKHDYDRTIADFTKAIELYPKFAAFYNGRAWAYFKAGKAAQGLPDAEKSLELQPSDAHALDTRASIFEALGRKEEAIADFRRALAKNPNIQNSKDGLKRLGATP